MLAVANGKSVQRRWYACYKDHRSPDSRKFRVISDSEMRVTLLGLLIEPRSQLLLLHSKLPPDLQTTHILYPASFKQADEHPPPLMAHLQKNKLPLVSFPEPWASRTYPSRRRQRRLSSSRCYGHHSGTRRTKNGTTATWSSILSTIGSW